jgi:hypothetical protein
LADYVNATFAGITRRVVDGDLNEDILALVECIGEASDTGLEARVDALTL